MLLIRDFLGAKRIYEDRSIKPNDRPEGRMMELVQELDFEDAMGGGE